jgi:hypothetical protein
MNNYGLTKILLPDARRLTPEASFFKYLSGACTID